MDLREFGDLASSLPGVRRTRGPGRARWQVEGRLLARELDPTHVVVRVPFELRDLLLRRAPEVFSVPTRMARHMSVVADLAATARPGEGSERAAERAEEGEAALEDAITAAWRMQTRGSPDER